ncbi:MAG: TIGR04282 family arsenosugar biosynthesis glycosyltransferase [Elusimicrobiota bacterium]|nr:TIGR04282 family arsenosugar biosynthesis glycosyltransferase [Elusimicrobiota bacterium]
MNSLIVFVKAPVPGKVKTRLQMPLSAPQAARVYEAFVRDTVDCARRSGGAAVSVAYEPHPKRPDLTWLEDSPPWFPQADGDLGARLIAAFDRAFRAGAEKVVVIGSDCPDLDPDILRQALARLDDAEVVLGPAEDGGYYLVGLRAPKPHLFMKMEWSNAFVFERTLERLRLRGESFAVLPERADVDTFGDLKSLSRRICGRESAALHTRAAIEDLILEDLFRMPVGEGVNPWTGDSK